MNWLFWPLALIYGFIVQVRKTLFDRGFLKSQKVSAYVISVGNITAGGTGKTPLAAYIAKSLVDLNYKVAIVSRGYRGTYKTDGLLVDSSVDNASALFGDEPVMLSQKTKVPVYVGRARVAAAKKAVDNGATAIVMDDGFQHRWLFRDLDIVVFDATETQWQLLPVGRLREPLKNLKRAKIVFISRARSVSPQQLERVIDFVSDYGFSQSQKNLFFIDFKISNIVHVHTQSRLTGSECFLLSAIGQPKNFETSMRKKFSVKSHFVFPDHYLWSQQEWSELLKKCQQEGGWPIVMTEKDAVKVRSLNSDDYPVFYTQTELIMDKDFQLQKYL